MTDTHASVDYIKRGVLGLIASIILIFLDQLTKYFAVTNLKNGDPFVIIKNVFELHYLENHGAAFGVLQGKKMFFVIFTIVVLCALIYLYFRMPAQKRYQPIQWILIFFIAGAIGNFIDRVRQDYVIDFFYFKLIDFPIFNVADIYVTVAAFFVIILGLFYYKEADYEMIFPSKSDSKKKKDTPNE